MTNGPLLGKIIRFSMPLMLANAMSLMFNAADLIVVGRFADSGAMAAVGAAPGFNNLMLNLFWGVASAVNVLVSRYTGAKDRKNVFSSVHTSIAVALIGGLIMCVLGIAVTRPMMRWMAVPAEIFDKACLYTWICCLGIPFMVLYSFGSAVLRAIGDTKRPLTYIAIAGTVNVLLNLLFVIVFKMDVAGVAIATKLSNVLSAILVLRALNISREQYRLIWKRLHIKGHIVKELFRIGLPAGVQGMMYSVSNMIIQSTINSFGKEAIAGSTAALSIEGVVHVAFSSFGLAVVSFVGQNNGADKPKRVIRSILLCLSCSCLTAFVLGGAALLLKRQLLGIYNPDSAVIDWGVIRMNYQLPFYFLVASIEVLTGSLRGLGYSLGPTIISMFGACAFRVLWILFIFPYDPRMQNVMISYPVSWALVAAGTGIMLIFVCRKMVRKSEQKRREALAETAGKTV